MVKDNKNGIILIIPNIGHIYSQVANIPLLVRFTDYLEYADSFKSFYEKNRQVKGAIIDYSSYPVSFIPIENKEHSKSVYIYACCIGDFRIIIDMLPILRKNFTFFFPPDKIESYRNVKVLSSLGIDCGIELSGKEILWDEVRSLGDFISHSLKMNGHAYPFSYIRQHYDPRNYLDFNIPFLNTGLNYLHADEDLNIYLSKEDMTEKNPVGQGVEFLARFSESQIFREEKHRWKKFFLTMNACSTCSAFRICLGKFSGDTSHMLHCKDCFSHFFNEIGEKDKNNMKLGVALIKP